MVKEHTPSLHLLTPPQREEDLVTWLRLLRSRRVGPATFYRLMAEHGSAADALAALPGIAGKAGVSGYKTCPKGVALGELKAGRMVGASLITRASADYPPLLAVLPDAPPLLWAMGDLGVLTRPMVALVGARNASSLGTRMARRLASGLTDAGYVVVSGLARGIDAAAHLAAAKGTMAVMAGGVDVVYPAENAVLAQEIAETGLRISEQPIGLQPLARHFPQRNRLISGVAKAVIVVEAAARSGSLITARNALDQGREVLAVPGHPLDARAAGCNMLIRDGARLVRCTEDVIEVLTDLKPPVPQTATKGEPAAPRSKLDRDQLQLHLDILDRLGPSPVAEDQLIRDLQLPAGDVAPEIVNLELEGKITRQSGGLLALAR